MEADPNGERGIAIHWVRTHRRTAEVARRLGVRAEFVFPTAGRGTLALAWRYVRSAVRTWRVLSERSPAFAVVVVPPNVVVPVVELYRTFHRRPARVVYDAHTGAILDRKWRWSLFLLRGALKGRRTALAVTLPALAERVDREARAYRLPDPLPVPPPADAVEARSDPASAFVVSSFAADEPLAEVLAAAATLPELRFRVSGDRGRVDPDVVRRAPPNVEFTGYLPDDAYWRELRSARVAVVLTTRPLTLVCGAYEALVAGTPVVLSDHAEVREFFHRGATFAAPTAEGIATAVRDALVRRDELAAEIPGFLRAYEEQWGEDFARLSRFLGDD